jgi:hypothetical protein
MCCLVVHRRIEPKTVFQLRVALQRNPWSKFAVVTAKRSLTIIFEMSHMTLSLLLQMICDATVPAQCPLSARTVPVTVPVTVPDCENTRFFNGSVEQEESPEGLHFFKK